MFLDGSDGEQSDVLIFTDIATLLHTHANIAFDNATAGCAEDADGWLACDPAAELRTFDYSPDRGAPGVRVLDGDGGGGGGGGGGGAREFSVLYRAIQKMTDGASAYVYTRRAAATSPSARPTSGPPATRSSSRRAIGSTSTSAARDGRRRAARPLHARVLEPQLPPTSIKVTLSGDDLLTRTEMPCEVSSTHPRAFIRVWAAGAADGRVVRLRGLADGARRRRVLRRVRCDDGDWRRDCRDPRELRVQRELGCVLHGH